MPYKKTHPGLDQVLTDEALDEFINGVPLALEEPPPRVWPNVILAALVGAALGIVAGFSIARAADWRAAVLAVVVLGGVAVAVVWSERRGR